VVVAGDCPDVCNLECVAVENGTSIAKRTSGIEFLIANMNVAGWYVDHGPSGLGHFRIFSVEDFSWAVKANDICRPLESHPSQTLSLEAVVLHDNSRAEEVVLHTYRVSVLLYGLEVGSVRICGEEGQSTRL
jgi:hypothetical protein